MEGSSWEIKHVKAWEFVASSWPSLLRDVARAIENGTLEVGPGSVLLDVRVRESLEEGEEAPYQATVLVDCPQIE